MKEVAEEWTIKAENDFAVAHLAMRKEKDEPPIADAVCFHCQQCVEKYLKAFLVEHEIRFRPAHPLIPLLETGLLVDPEFEQLREDLIRLDGYAVEVRYPGVSVTPEMAENALAAASRVRAFIRTKLGLDEPPPSKGE